MSDSHNVGAFQVKTMFGWRTIEIHRVTWSVEKTYLAAPTRPIIDGETWRGEWRVLNEAGDEIGSGRGW